MSCHSLGTAPLELLYKTAHLSYKSYFKNIVENVITNKHCKTSFLINLYQIIVYNSPDILDSSHIYVEHHIRIEPQAYVLSLWTKWLI